MSMSSWETQRSIQASRLSAIDSPLSTDHTFPDSSNKSLHCISSSGLTQGSSFSPANPSSSSDPTFRSQFSPDSPNKSTLETLLSSQPLSLPTKLGLSGRPAQNSFSLSPAHDFVIAASDTVPLLNFHTRSSLSVPFTKDMLSHDRHSLEEKLQEHPLCLSDSWPVKHGSKRQKTMHGIQRNISLLPMLENLPVSDKWSNDDENLGQTSRRKEFVFPSLSGLHIWPPKLKETTYSCRSSLYYDASLSGPPFGTASTFTQPLVEVMA
ncbi:hypothetical protein CPB84DRAFT_1786959 [Gymnopilus junonius]|uniref:Uncharacterized protein n=1 Tax=Gymnopilus junonius TaxID=109634 RepID=A0A9P5NHR5_GYMJU|nr:hypothetical protein CPB84DRAFT_1786959 [Gymnopilus junonius]